ncbi:MAG TPA: hypothetical protein VF790_08060 [Dissulfurispiraceae bacterium]
MHFLPAHFLRFARKRNISGDSFIVGGAVRDLLLDKGLKDVDIAVKGDALKIAEEFAAEAGGTFVPLDRDFGIARVVKGERSLDIAALRGDSIRSDLADRDLTINAMAIPLEDLPPQPPLGKGGLGGYSLPNVIDPFNGREALLNGIVRMVSEENLVKDPLRIIRVFRFSATLGFSIEERTRDAAARHKHLLHPVAGERIAEEMRHILSVRDSRKAMRAMAEANILRSLFPGLGGEAPEHALRLYEGTEEILNAPSSFFPEYAWAISEYFSTAYKKACLKLSTIFPDPSSAEDAVLRLKMSGREAELIRLMVSNRNRIAVMYAESGGLEKRAAIYLIKEFRDDVYPLLVLAAAQSHTRGGGIASFCRSLLSFYHEEIKPRMEMPPFVTGDDLISEFRLQPSPLFGKILGGIEDKTLSGELKSREDALGEIRKMLETGQY